MIGSCETLDDPAKDSATTGTIERKLKVSERSAACMWREIYSPVIWREFKASCRVNCEEHLRADPVKDLSRAFRTTRRTSPKTLIRIRRTEQKFSWVRLDFLRSGESCGNLLLSERVLTYRTRRIAPPMIGEGSGGRWERRMGVVKERLDKSQRKERINRARPLSTYLSAIREHPSLFT